MTTGISWLSVGELEYGTSEQLLPMPDGYGMAGYSLGGKKGRVGSQSLYARSLALRDHRGEEVVLCVLDQMCPSLALFEAVAAKSGVDRARLVLCATHTHTAPGHHYANSFYRVFAQPLRADSLFAPNLAWIDQLASRIAQGINAARAARLPGVLGVGQKDLFGVARNRSEAPFLGNPEALTWAAPGWPSEHAPATLESVQKAIDPRVTCVAVRPKVAGAADSAAFAFYACHATALGPTQETYHRDWPGYAVDEVERRHPTGVVAALGLACAGDVSPLPPGEVEGPAQGVDLAMRVGKAVGEVVSDVLADLAPSAAPLELHVSAGALIPGPGQTWDVGYPILYGAEDGRTEILGGVLDEGMRKRPGTQPAGDEQWPKRSVLPLLQQPLRGMGLRPAPFHPVHRVHLGSHALLTVPGEPTTVAGHRLREDAVAALSAVTSASVIGYAGDYAGYFTTPEEYLHQHYEGAHTLYGSPSLRMLTEALLQTPPMPAPGASLVAPAAPPPTAEARLIEDAALGISVSWSAASPAGPTGPAELDVEGVVHVGVVAHAEVELTPPRTLYVAYFSALTPADVAGKTLSLSGFGVSGTLPVAH